LTMGDAQTTKEARVDHTPRSAIFHVSPVILPENFGLRRESPRALSLRQPDFDEKFDTDTLFYDVFRHPNNSKILMVGPSLYNLSSLFEDMRITALPSGEVCTFERQDFDRLTRITVDAPAGTSELVLRCSQSEFNARVLEAETQHYKSLRVLYAISKNNELDWICDWARFNRDVHGAEAVLLFDNESTAYDVEELRARLTALRGIKFVGIVPLPFRFGPPGIGLRGSWDSNFLQIGSFEIARWRFLHDARSFLNTDVDELVVSRRGRSIFEAAERGGIARFYGIWVPNIPPANEQHDARDVIRHKDFKVAEKPTYSLKRPPRFQANACQPKWATVPRRVPWKAHLTHHRIKQWWRSRLWTDEFTFRHFRGLSTGWKYQRDRQERFDLAKHRVDEDLSAAFARVDWNT
jgi:hypothetical protein